MPMFGRYLKRLARVWGGLSLAWQFVIAGGIGLLAVMVVVGLWVTSQIRDGVLHNTAATTALYVDSVITPLLPDMRKSQEHNNTNKQTQNKTQNQNTHKKKQVSFKLWRRDGTVLYSK